jgi:hypothetical protein
MPPPRVALTYGGLMMKWKPLIGLLILSVMAIPQGAAAGLTYQLGDETALNLGFSLDTLVRLTDFRNPNSNDADEGLDFLLKRGRVRLSGHCTDYAKFFLQTDASVATDNDASARVSDATLNLHYKELAQFIMGLQKAPAYRSILTDDDALMSIDRPGITNYNLTWGLRGGVEFNTIALRNSNSGIHGPFQDRDLGATFFGTYSFTDFLHLKYYAGLYKGIQKAPGDDDHLRSTVRIQMNLFDPEPDFENRGTYLGSKKTVAIAWSCDRQTDVTIDSIKGNGVSYFSCNEMDLFVEYPAGPGSITFEGSYEHT